MPSRASAGSIPPRTASQSSKQRPAARVASPRCQGARRSGRQSHRRPRPGRTVGLPARPAHQHPLARTARRRRGPVQRPACEGHRCWRRRLPDIRELRRRSSASWLLADGAPTLQRNRSRAGSQIAACRPRHRPGYRQSGPADRRQDDGRGHPRQPCRQD